MRLWGPDRLYVGTRDPFTRLLPIAALVVLLTALGLLAAYVYTFGFRAAERQDVWGQFGDYFGGVLNPVIGLLTLAAIWLTLTVTHKLYLATKRQIEVIENASEVDALAIQRQAFESRFFHVLRLHEETVQRIVIPDSIEVGPGGRNRVTSYRGATALTELWSEYERVFEVEDAKLRGSLSDVVLAKTLPHFLHDKQDALYPILRIFHIALQLVDRNTDSWPEHTYPRFVGPPPPEGMTGVPYRESDRHLFLSLFMAGVSQAELRFYIADAMCSDESDERRRLARVFRLAVYLNLATRGPIVSPQEFM